MRKPTPTHPSLYTPEQQTRANKEVNNNKRSHLIALSSFITWEWKLIERIQCAAMPSHSFITWERRTIEWPQCTVMRSSAQSFFYHMGRENNRMAPMCSHTQQCTVITCRERFGAANKNNRRSGTIVVNLYLVQGDQGYIRTSSLDLFRFSPSSISSVFRYT